MTKTLLPLATALALVLTAGPGPTAATGAPSAPPEPPYEGTVFLDPDIVLPADPSAFASLSYAGRGQREVYDRREGWVRIEAYLFDVSYDDGLATQAVVNPEFGSVDAAREQAQTYAWLVGQLPHALRVDVDELWIHRGTEPFGGGNRSILIHTDQADDYRAGGLLEEVLVHEAAHTSLDAGYYLEGSGWRQAQADDDAFISTYARDHPLREDVAETFLLYQALRYRLDRIDPDVAATVRDTVPHRIRFLDREALAMHPVASTLVARTERRHDGWVRESSRASGRGGRATAQGRGLPVGDDRKGREIRALHSFDLGPLPRNAFVSEVRLQLNRLGSLGSAPRRLRLDLRRGSFGSPAPQARDFSAPATRSLRVRYRAGRGPLRVAIPAYDGLLRPGGRLQVRVRALPVRDRNGRADQVVLGSARSPLKGARLTLRYTTR